MLVFICVLFLDILYVQCNLASENVPTTAPTVETNNGAVFGKTVETILADGSKAKVDAFLGIPFAKPPVGDLRFADPVPFDNWSTPRAATNFSRACILWVDHAFPGFEPAEMWNPPGHEKGISEDCLYLNVWGPTNRKKNGRLPVFVWIYGGGFYSGTASLWVYNGQFLSASQNMIVVSMNYRLSSLGFLSTGDGVITGNFGLKDQQLAMKWVKNNIERFGGDPNDVTIAGESAGAGSVGFHYLVKSSWGLFNRAVMNSGSPLANWAVITADQMKLYSSALIKILKCDQQHGSELLQCLRALPAMSVLQNDYLVTSMMRFAWAPIVDGIFLEDTPQNLLAKNEVSKTPLITSFNRDEGTYWSLYGFPDQFSKDKEECPISYKNFKKDVRSVESDLPKQIQKKIINTYDGKGAKKDKNELAHALHRLVGDRSFVCPVLDWAKTLSAKGIPVYMYRLNHVASTEQWPKWMGVIHGADCQWTFGIPLERSRGYTNQEIEFAAKFMKYHGNFASNGDPNAKGMPVWSKYGAKKMRALCFEDDLNVHECFVPKDYVKLCKMWRRYEKQSTCCPLAV